MIYTICPLCGVKAYGRSHYGNGHYCFPRLGGCGTAFPAEVEKVDGLYKHIIPSGKFLNIDIVGYFHDYYIPIKFGGSEFSRLILNIKGNGTEEVKERVAKIIEIDIRKICNLEIDLKLVELIDELLIIAVPRSKPDEFWSELQLQFKEAVSKACKNSSQNLIDGSRYFKRVKETKTTHLSSRPDLENNGDEPYPGITHDTCELKGSVSGKTIILVDDIYTENKGVDEDCIQFLLNKGAKKIVLYTLGKTKNG